MLLFLFHEVWATSPNPPPSRLHCVHEKFILKVQSSVQKRTIMTNEDRKEANGKNFAEKNR